MSETRSMTFSQWTMNSVRSRAGSRFFSSDFPVFPFFLAMEPDYHYILSYVGLIIQFLQMLSFVVNPRVLHGETLSALSNVVYATRLPLWDEAYASLSWVQYLPFFCLAVVLVVGVWATSLWYILSHAPSPRDDGGVQAVRALLHLTTSVLFVPILDAMLSQMVCSNDHLWTFPSEKCFHAPSTLATFIVGVVTFVLVVALTSVEEVTLFKDDYLSQNPLTRKQYINSSFYVLWRFLTCVLFHIFLSNSTASSSDTTSRYTYTWLSMYVFFSASLMAASYAFFLPFLNQKINRLYCGAFVTTAMVGFVSFFCSEGAIHPALAAKLGHTGFAEMDLDGLLILGTALLFFYVGWALADFRINREMVQSLPQLMDAGAPYPPTYTCLFPKGLPEYELTFNTSADTCGDVADGAVVEERVKVSLETPYLTHVYTYTDVEVATRFLAVSHRLTGLYPTPEMLHLAAQIFTKGTFRFPGSASLMVDFASMISTFTTKASLGLAICERVAGMSCSFPTRYRAYRLVMSLKFELHLRDMAYQRTCDNAKRAHKDILSSLSQFWNKLLSQQTDRNQILTAYSMIARRREETNRMFTKALQQQTSDRDLLLKYADFLEQVMLQTDRADQLRALAEQEMEEEKKRRGRLLKYRPSAAALRKLLRQETSSSDGGAGQIFGARGDAYQLLKLGALVFFSLVTVGLLVTFIVGFNRRAAALRCVQHSATARNLQLAGDLVTLQYWSEDAVFASSGPRLHYLLAAAEDLLSLHNFLILGLPRSLTRARENAWTSPRVMGVSLVDDSTAVYNSTTFLDQGYDYAQFLQGVPGVIGREAVAVSSSTLSSVAAQQAREHLGGTRAAVDNNYARAWRASAYNASVITCRDWYDEERDVFTAVLCGLYSLGVLALCFYVAISILTSPVEKLKNRILSLLGFIPQAELQKIAQQARQRVENFDTNEGSVTEDADSSRIIFRELYRGASDHDEASRANHDLDAGQDDEGLSNREGASGGAGSGAGATAAAALSLSSPSKDTAASGERRGGNDAPRKVTVLDSVLGSVFGNADGDDETQEQQALLWGNGAGRGGGKGQKLTDQSGLERELSLEDEGQDATVPKHVIGAIQLREHLLLLFLIALLAGVLVMSALNVPLLRSNRRTQRGFTSRAQIYTKVHNSALTAGYEVTAFFSSGDESLSQLFASLRSDVMRDLPDIIAYRPLDTEVQVLGSLASAIQTLNVSFTSVKAFTASMSGTTALYDAATQTVVQSTTGEAVREAFFNSKGPYDESTPVFSSMMDSIVQADESVVTVLSDLSSTKGRNTGSTAVTRATIVISSLAVAALLITALVIHLHGNPFFFGRSKLGWLLLLLSIAATVTTLVLECLILSRLSSITTFRRELVSVTDEYRLATKSFMWPIILAGRMAQEGSNLQTLDLLNYFDYLEDDTYWRTFANGLDDPVEASTFTNATERLLSFQLIAIKLQASATGIDPPEVENYEWDFAAEPDAMETRVRFSDAKDLRYSTTAADLARSSIVKVMMARDVLSNPRAQSLVQTASDICNSVFEERLTRVLDRIVDASESAQTFSSVSTATAAVAMLATTFFVLVFLLCHTQWRRHQMGVSSDTFSSAYQSTRIWASVFTLLVCLSVVFAVGMVGLQGSEGFGEQVDYMNARSAHATWGMLAAELWSMGLMSLTGLRGEVMAHWEALNTLQTQLSSGTTSILGASSALDYLLQGSNAQLSPSYRYSFDPATAPAKLNESEWTFTNGLESAVAAWMQRTLELLPTLESGTASTQANAMEALRDTIMPLIRGLDEASALLLDALLGRMKAFFIASVTLSSVLLAVEAAVIVFLLYPVARRQSLEETGYRMLVRLIPGDIRRSIPAIREFISTDAANGSADSTSEAGHTAGSSSSHTINGTLNMGSFDELSTPIIAIDSAGIVLKFNQQAEEVFGYAAAEVLGNNVSVLMPERIARRHDGFLAAYARARHPGNRSVFQAQPVMARKRNGDLFDVQLTIHEMKRSNGERAYVGYAENITNHVKANKEERLNRFVQDEAVVPMIAIDSLGTVLCFNKAAEECFGRNAAEVLDQNVKILMPEDIAVRHDGYLATYLRTREKHTIDSVAHSRGVRKNGEEFPIELRIREIVHDNVSTYVGFCRDLSIDTNLEEAVLINNIIFETSVVPVVCTDLLGRVILYSRSAERVFGYTAEEVEGLNCKMLMPDTVADRHDGYMEQYRSSWSKRVAPMMNRQVVGRHKDGHLIPVLASLHEVKSSTAAHTVIVGFFRELSEERALERGLSIDDIVAECLQIPLVVTDSQGIIEKVNRATLLEFGYRHKEELLRKNVKMLMPSDVAMRHDDYINRYLLTGIGRIITTANDRSVLSPGRRVTAKRRDGSTFPAEIRLREVRRAANSSWEHSMGNPSERATVSGAEGTKEGGEANGDSDEVHFVGYVRNLTKLVRLERQLALNQVTLEHSPMPLCLINEDGGIVKANQPALLMLRCNSVGLLGRPFTSLFLPGATEPMSGAKRGSVATHRDTHRAPEPRKALPRKASEVAHKANHDSTTETAASVASFVNKVTTGVIVSQDHSHIPVAVTMRAVGGDMATALDAGTAPVAYLAYIRDTSEDGAVSLRALRNAKVAELSPVPIVYFNASGLIVDVNAATQKQLGYALAELTGQHVRCLLPDPLILADVLLESSTTKAGEWGLGEGSSVSGSLGSGATSGADSTQTRYFEPPQPHRAAGRDTAAAYRLFKTEMKAKIGRRIPIELHVAQVLTQQSADSTSSTFVAYMYDQSGSIQLEAATEACLSLSELSPHPIVAVNPHGTITLCNSAGCTTFGYGSPSDLVGKNISMLMCEPTDDKQQQFMDLYHQIQESSRLGHATNVQCRRADGAPFPCSLTLREVTLGGAVAGGEEAEGAAAAPSQGGIASNENVMYIGRFVDRSEDAAAHCAKAFLQTLLQLSKGAAMLRISDSGEIQQVSAEAAEMLGYADASELAGKAVQTVMPDVNLHQPPASTGAPETAAASKPLERNSSVADEEVSADGTDVSALIAPVPVIRKRALVLRRKDGSLCAAELHLRCTRMGDVKLFIACLVNPSAAGQIHAKRSANMALMEHCPVPVIVVDADGTVRAFSPTAEQFFEWTAAAVVGRHGADILDLLPTMPGDEEYVREAPSSDGESNSSTVSAQGDAGLQRIISAAVDVPSGSDDGALRDASVDPPRLLRDRLARLRHGEVVAVDLSVTAVPAADGVHTQYVIFVIDRRHEDATGAAQRASDAVARTMPLPSLVVSEAGVILEANEHASSFTEYAHDELEGELVSMVVSLKSILPPSSASAEDSVCVRRAVSVLTKGGVTKLADVHVCSLRPGSGVGSYQSDRQPPHRRHAASTRVLYVSFVDHTTSSELARVTQRFKTLFNSVNTPVARLDADTLHVLGCNPAATRLLRLDHEGRSRRQVILRARSAAGATIAIAGAAASYAMQPAAKDDDATQDSGALLTDVLTDFMAVRQLREFVSAELGPARTQAYSAQTAVPSLRLRTYMELPEDADTLDDSHIGFFSSSAVDESSAPSDRASFEDDSEAEKRRAWGRTLEVELLFELVGHRLLLYVSDVAAERQQQLQSSLLAAMQSTLREPYLVVSDDDLVVSFNAAATKLLGYQLPPDGTMSALNIVAGGITALYTDSGSASRADAECTEDEVVATLELALNCPFVPIDGARGGTAVMQRQRVASPESGAMLGHGSSPEVGAHNSSNSDSSALPRFAPLPFGSTALESPDSSALARDTEDHPRGSAVGGAAEVADPHDPRAASRTHRTVTAEMHSRRRLLTRVPCRHSDGRTVLLDVRLCEVQVPLEAPRASAPPPAHDELSMPDVASPSPVPAAGAEEQSEASVTSGAEAAMARYLVVFLRDPSANHRLSVGVELGEYVLERHPTAVVVADVNGTITVFNAAAERLFLFDRAHVLGKNVSLLMPESQAVRHNSYLQFYMEKREKHVIGAPRQVVAERRDGERILVELNLQEVLDDGNNVYRFVAFMRLSNRSMMES